MKIALLSLAVRPGDAVSNDVLGMANCLRDADHAVAISVRFASGDIPVMPLAQLKSWLTDPEDVLIYHHSIGCEEATILFEQLRCRKILKYHNVTPGHFFSKLDPALALSCQAGIDQLSRLVAQDAAIWCDSEFNAKQIRELTDRSIAILPPFNQVAQLLNSPVDLTFCSSYDDWRTNFLMVGRMVPNKNHKLAIDSFVEYLTRYDSQARLILVGSLTDDRYSEEVLNHIRSYGIGDRVLLTGKVSLAQLKAIYLASQALLTTSSHEGFCLPLVEAMGLMIPIVALKNGAIPDTAGEAAWYAEENPQSIAKAMHTLRSDPKEREKRLALSWDRYDRYFTQQVIQSQFQDLFSEATIEKMENQSVRGQVSKRAV